MKKISLSLFLSHSLPSYFFFIPFYFLVVLTFISTCLVLPAYSTDSFLEITIITISISFCSLNYLSWLKTIEKNFQLNFSTNFGPINRLDFSILLRFQSIRCFCFLNSFSCIIWRASICLFPVVYQTRFYWHQFQIHWIWNFQRIGPTPSVFTPQNSDDISSANSNGKLMARFLDVVKIIFTRLERPLKNIILN